MPMDGQLADSPYNPLLSRPRSIRRYDSALSTTVASVADKRSSLVAYRLAQSSMPKQKRKLTTQEKAEKARRNLEFMTIFIKGKQKRVRRPVTIEGMSEDEFVLANADPSWLHQNELWHLMEQPLGK